MRDLTNAAPPKTTAIEMELRELKHDADLGSVIAKARLATLAKGYPDEYAALMEQYQPPKEEDWMNHGLAVLEEALEISLNKIADLQEQIKTSEADLVKFRNRLDHEIKIKEQLISSCKLMSTLADWQK